MTYFDRVVLIVAGVLAITIALVSFVLLRLGPTVDGLQTAKSLDGTLVNSQIAITFSQPMRPVTVQRNFQISPNVSGDFSWSGNQMLYIPRHNLRYQQTYHVRVNARAQDRGGQHLARTFESAFTTQSQHLLYLGTEGSEQNRLVLAGVNGKREVVGTGEGAVTAFSVSSDRSLAVYVRRGAPGERPDEIWLLSLADNTTGRVFRRPDWSLTQPHFSPDGRYIAFLATNVQICRVYYGCYRDKTGPLIQFLDLKKRKVFPFRSSTDIPITNFIDFSPRGQIAYTDLSSSLTLASIHGTSPVHIPNNGNSLTFAGFSPAGDKAVFVGQTPASTGGDILVYASGKYSDVSHGIYDSSTPVFSTSGSRLAYAAYRGELGIEPIYGINIYSFRTRKTSRLTAERKLSDWAPQWSFADDFVAFVRSQPQEAMYLGSGEIWVARRDGRDAHPLGGIGRDIQWVT